MADIMTRFTSGRYFKAVQLLTILLMIVCNAFSQSSFEMSMSYNSYTMGDMKELQIKAQEDAGIEGKIVDAFPMHFGFSAQINIKEIDLNEAKVELGANVSYMSSGSRINYSDYSGYFNFDQLVNRTSIAGIARVFLKPEKKFSYGPEVNVIGSLSNLSFETDLNLYNSARNTDDLRFSSRSLQLRVNWLSRFNFLQKFYIINKVGYEIDIYSGKLIFSQNSDAHLLNVRNDPARLDWSGFRINLGVGIYL